MELKNFIFSLQSLTVSSIISVNILAAENYHEVFCDPQWQKTKETCKWSTIFHEKLFLPCMNDFDPSEIDLIAL